MPDYIAAVVFDPSAREYSILSDKKALEGATEGTVVEFDGRHLEVAALCRNSTDARSICDDLATNRSSSAAGSQSNKSSEIMIGESSDSADEVRDSSDDGLGESNILQMVSYAGEATPESAVDESVEVDRYRQESCEPPMNFESVGIVRDLLQNLLHEMSEDVSRINRRFQEIRQILVRYYGTASDGSVVNNFDEYPQSIALGGDLSPSRSLLTRRDTLTRKPDLPNYFDKIVQQELKRKAAKRVFDADEYMEDRSPPRKKESTIGRAGPVLRYPFIARLEEEDIFRRAQGSYAVYAQQLSRQLFADTLHLYFKDQDAKKRNWFHEAVDFRFPAEDRAAHLQKWKNCSYYINKNMTLNAREKKNKSRSLPGELTFKYLNSDIEKSCHERSNNDATKYAELMAFHLFSDSLQNFFKEQDPKRKDWLRECVDVRFPIHDKLKRDQRWKVCAVACNKNRTKVVGEDGAENPFPYFSKDIEEECYKKSNGVPATYCELMCEHLFPNSQHLYFKDRDLGKRNWLHEILDRRFPTPEKFAHVAKWKCCTSAANKYINGISELPVPVVTIKEEKPEVVRKTKSDNSVSSNQTNQSRNKAQKSKSTDVPSTSTSTTTINLRGSKRNRKDGPVFSSDVSVDEEEEADCWDDSKGNIQVYARNIGRAVFKDSLKLNFKDQNEEKKKWIQEVIQWRFPNADLNPDSRQWRVVVASINKNVSLR